MSRDDYGQNVLHGNIISSALQCKWFQDTTAKCQNRIPRIILASERRQHNRNVEKQDIQWNSKSWPSFKKENDITVFDIMQECPLCKNILSTAYSTGSPIKVLTRLRSNIIKQTLWYGIAHGNYDRYPKLYRYKQADDTILNAL